jgi:hypothetical protein
MTEDWMPNIRYQWAPVEIHSGALFEFSDQAIRFVSRILASPAVYRWAVFENQVLRKVCIAETDNLRRRVREYLNPGPTQYTNKRLNAEFKRYVQDGLSVQLESLRIDPVHLNRVLLCNENLHDQFVRKMMENFALADHDVTQSEILNLSLDPLARRRRKASLDNPYADVLRGFGVNAD